MDSNTMHKVYFGLGSNLGDKQKNLNDAIEMIKNRIGTVVAQSDFIVTEPVGFVSDNAFLNAAIAVETSLSPKDVLLLTQQIESELGRIHKSVDGVYDDRIIDVDILVFDDVTMDSSDLTIPHPRMKERSFVLEPLCQLAPDLVIPGETLTIAELLARIS